MPWRKPRGERGIFDDPVVQEKLGAARCAVEASRVLSYRVIDLRAKGSEPTADTNIARVAGTLCENAVSDLALEIAGQGALTYGSFAESYWRLAMTAGRRGRNDGDQPESDRQPLARTPPRVAVLDLDWNDDQRAILEAVEALCSRHAGAERAIELDAKGDWDAALDAALREAGFDTLALPEAETGALEAAMAVEAVARHAGTLPAGAQLLVAPRIAERVLPGPVALVSLAHPGPVRFGSVARTALVDCGDEARWVTLGDEARQRVPSNFMLPVGQLEIDSRSGESLGEDSGARMRRWWRVALASEMLGTMQAALDVTVEYVKRRRQFGRAIGSFQALQHRLASCSVLVEGTRRLTFEAAGSGAPDEASAVAVAYAADAANTLFRETHQMTGAMGFTREHDLHVFSMRLQALRLELGGISAHLRAVAASRWGAGS